MKGEEALVIDCKSGKRRDRCKAVTCGAPQCDACTPWIEGMQRLMGREF